MKRALKLVLVAIPAIVFAATVGLSTMGCDDDTTVTVVQDLSAVPDMAHVTDMAKKD
jgi:hypothetical protein